MTFRKETSPHIHRPDNLKWMLLHVIIALMPVVIWAFVVYPLSSLRIFPISLAICLLSEFVFVLIREKSPKAFHVENLLAPIITALIYGLCLPTELSWSTGMGYFIVAIGALLGMVVGKLVFGGFGNNIFNPAALGMIIVRLFFGGYGSASGSATNFIDEGIIGTGATSLTGIGSYANISKIRLVELFLGRVPGALGETFHIAILLGLVYLIVTQTIDWRVFVSYVGTFAVLMLTAGIVIHLNMKSVDVGTFLFYQVFSGGFLFGAVYMMTDPVTGPVGTPARVIFGCFGGIVVTLIRLFAGIEGVGLSILAANLIAPLLNYPKWTSSTWKKWHGITLGVMGVLAFAFVILGLIFKEGAIR